MCQILSEGIIKKTRKTHRCYICDKWIFIGSECNWQVNTGGDWDFGTAYWHLDCKVEDYDE